MNVAEYITFVLTNEKIKYVFGYQGGNVTYLIDAIGRSEKISYIQSYNEQGAAFAANAYAQISENFGVAISSSGPGAINMINGIANAYYDSIPCLFITGNVNSSTMRKSKNIRQNGFQETNIVEMVREITKYAVTVLDAEEIPSVLDMAVKKMKEGRKGPVLLDIPHNIQRTEINTEINKSNILFNETHLDKKNIEKVWEGLLNSNKPLLWIGGGCRTSECRNQIKKFLDKCPIPVVSSLCGKDVLENTHYCYRGMVGGYGFSYTNDIVKMSDFILALGTRFDERQRFEKQDVFLKGKKVIHVDIDPYELAHIIKNEVQICSSCEKFMDNFLKIIKITKNWEDWVRQTEILKINKKNKEYVLGDKVDEAIKNILGKQITDANITVDVGIHQMASAQSVIIGSGTNYLNSGGLGAMGYSIPAIIGAYFAAKEKKQVCICGDGGFMMNIQELQTIIREKIPVFIIIINNHELGMISEYQKVAMDGRFYGSQVGYKTPIFSKIATAFGFNYLKYNSDIFNLNNIEHEPTIIEIEVPQNEKI